MQGYIKLFSPAPMLLGSLYGNDVSLVTANIKAKTFQPFLDLNMATFEQKLDPLHLQKLRNVPEVPVTQLYRDMINASEPIHSFTIKDDDKDSSLIWTILKHPVTYKGTVGMIFAVCIGVYCFKTLWIRSGTPRH